MLGKKKEKERKEGGKEGKRRFLSDVSRNR